MSTFKPTHEVFYVENYEVKGEEKRNFNKVGTIFQRANGSLVMKDSYGRFLEVFPIKSKEERESSKNFNASRDGIARETQPAMEQDDLPF